MENTICRSLLVVAMFLVWAMTSGCDPNLAFVSGPVAPCNLQTSDTPTEVTQGAGSTANSQTSQATPKNPNKGIVKLVRNESGWQLLRDSKPYYINGAGGRGSLEMLAQLGGNSSRTWGIDDTEELLDRLDEAEKNGISVALGIWLEHERHGKMKYTQYDKVVEQIELTLKHVRDLKHHPAILVWGIGNEMEGEGDNPAIWSHIEHLSRLVKAEDPNHPVMTVIAEMGGKKIEAIHKLCPSVDIIGINSYSDSKTIPERYKNLGGTKPYIVTEFGPIGTWEVDKNDIDAIDEPTSTAKAKMYWENVNAFTKDKSHCLGSYAFLWGDKQEGTATWFGMLLPDGKRTGAADVMSEFWTGKKPSNFCPQIDSMTLQGSPHRKKDETVTVKLTASDPENDELNVRWVMTGEADSYATGGDKQVEPKELEGVFTSQDLNGATLKLPSEDGIYRIYAYVDDGHGAATANVSIRVIGDLTPLGEEVPKAELPLVILDEAGKQVTKEGVPYYVPSGFMGSTDALKVVQDCADDPKFGEHCTKVTYSKPDDWGGVVWQHPESDWGEKAGGFDLTGAKSLSFWAKGKNGGEEVKFGLGVIGRDKTYFDTAKKEVPTTLTDQWEEYSIDIAGKDLRRIKSGLFFSLAGQGEEGVEFYLDRVSYQ